MLANYFQRLFEMLALALVSSVRSFRLDLLNRPLPLVICICFLLCCSFDDCPNWKYVGSVCAVTERLQCHLSTDYIRSYFNFGSCFSIIFTRNSRVSSIFYIQIQILNLFIHVYIGWFACFFAAQQTSVASNHWRCRKFPKEIEAVTTHTQIQFRTF